MAVMPGLKLPFLRQYDRFLAVLVLVGLLFSLVRLTQSGAERAASKANYAQALNDLKPEHPVARPFDMAPYEQALISLRAPRLLAVASNDMAGFFVPERRVWCVECRRPISFAAEICPFCNAAQPSGSGGGERDSDNDGIPDAKEIKWGLNPFDASDAVLDSDGDGFANQQEHNSGHNPRDSASHPDLDVLLRVRGIESKPFPLVLRGASRMPGGAWKVQVNLLTPDGHEGQTLWVMEGENIGVTGLKMGAFTPRKEMRPNPRLNNMLVEVDRSTASIIREADGRTFELTVGDRQSADLVATLELPIDRSVYTVSPGSVFKLRERTYGVINIDSDAFTVVIENKSTGKKLAVPR